MALFRIKFCWMPLLAAAVLSILLPAATFAQDDEEEENTRQPFEVSSSTSDLISSLKELDQAKDWEKALKLIDKGLSKAKAGSYDQAILFQLRAQTCYQKSDLPGTMDAVERCLAIDDQHHYFPKKTRREMLYLVAQIAFNEASAAKDLQQQQAFYAKSDRAMEEWKQGLKKFTPDNLLFIAMLYFYRAQPGAGIKGVQEHMDPALMEKALDWTNRGLRAVIHPRDNLYQLKLAELFQLGRFKEGAELLELILKRKPESKNYWQQLFNTYVQLANEATEKHEADTSLEYNIRAIVTIERAQKLGFLNSPRENSNLVIIHLGIGQFGEACRLLSTDLKDNTIDRSRQNYELLASAYQQIHREFKAIDALESAAKQYPHSGQIEYQIAQIYYSINKTQDAFNHMKLCIQKGGTEEPQVAWLFYSYLAFDLKNYDEALHGAAQAAKYPKGKEEASKMEEAIRATIQDRENRLQSQS